jgi:NADPH:quinone reductase-like Zn-dependent oxidoreductase
VSITFVSGDALGDALVWPGHVVVRLVVGQDGTQVCLAENQHAIQKFTAQGADQAFADRVHPRSLGSAAQDPRACSLEDDVERGSEVRAATCLLVSPARLTFEQAAVVAVSGLAAVKGLHVGRIAAGQKVLIIGASGGVGTYAVQLAKASGATVTGVASTAKADLVRSIGADEVIDYTREDFADGRQHYDLILDIGGNSRLSRLRRALTPKGTLVIAGGEGKWTGIGRQLRALALSPVVPQRLTMYVSSTNKRQADLDALRQHIETGHLTPIVGKTYPLPEVPEAIRHLEGGRAQGKIAITV